MTGTYHICNILVRRVKVATVREALVNFISFLRLVHIPLFSYHSFINGSTALCWALASSSVS
jgi:phosphatidylglycerophosphate synthase